MRYFTIGWIALVLVSILTSNSFAGAGIIVALNSDLEQLRKNLKTGQISKKAGREFYSGKIGDRDVVLVRSPMGKVNNAITAQLLLSHYPVRFLLSIGPGGAVDNGLNVGDVVIGAEVYQHDLGTIKPYGFIWSRVPDGTNWDEPGYNMMDKGLRKSASLYASAKKKGRNRIVQGVIVTGDQFISCQEKRAWLCKKFKGAAVDTGAAAIAQVCYANQIPCCMLRVITDKAQVNARTDFEDFIASQRSDIDIFGLVKALIQAGQKRSG
ncbi:MAG: 5'-methylthioadenosine/adenosylhomocysteine nucleosidase [Deltaproteobacteria bacterium]|jgi:adenosylhomocysteine nucleosidase|nr:5'-methylthioadenosine/adenosylhomocysteine nucleosidase [Deltaproteobacteria bacterium]